MSFSINIKGFSPFEFFSNSFFSSFTSTQVVFLIFCFQAEYIQNSKSTSQFHNHQTCLWGFNCFVYIWLFEIYEVLYFFVKRSSVSNKEYSFFEIRIFFKLNHRQIRFSKKSDRFRKKLILPLFFKGKEK